MGNLKHSLDSFKQILYLRVSLLLFPFSVQSFYGLSMFLKNFGCEESGRKGKEAGVDQFG